MRGRTYQSKFFVVFWDVRNGKFLGAGDRFCGNGDALGRWLLLGAERSGILGCGRKMYSTAGGASG